MSKNDFRKDNVRYAVLAAVLAISAPVPAAQTQLLAPQAGDLAVQQLGAADTVTPLINTSREVVNYSWAVDGKTPISPSQPHLAESRAYWLKVTDTELSQGVDLDTSAVGSMVKISPLGHDGAVDPADLELSDSRGVHHRGADAMDLIADAGQLAASGAPFPRGTSAFRVAAALGKGRFKLRAPRVQLTGRRYQVYVQETNSDVVLQGRTGSDTYLQGQELSFETRLEDSKGALPVQSMAGYLQSPDGAKAPVKFKRGSSGAFVMTMPLTQKAAAAPGLWEVHALVKGSENGLPVRRNVKTAFAYTVPQARLVGDVAVQTTAVGEIRSTLAVEVINAGRYELRGTLYGADRQGKQQPIMIADTAAWLMPGNGDLSLIFDKDLLAKSALGAPYEVRDLRLMDQSRMGTLRRQARGFQIVP